MLHRLQCRFSFNSATLEISFLQKLLYHTVVAEEIMCLIQLVLGAGEKNYCNF